MVLLTSLFVIRMASKRLLLRWLRLFVKSRVIPFGWLKSFEWLDNADDDKQRTQERENVVITFNDRAFTTKEDVLRVVDKAIEATK
jgi:hypothetical protein